MTLTPLGLPTVTRPVGPAPASGPLIDTYGRVAADLRVSLTDRCNLRCTYCMPAEGLDWLPGADLLTPEELTRLIRVAVTRLGITGVRFTGGEPLLVPHLEEVVAATAALQPRPAMAVTTNGIGLAKRAAALKKAGLNRVNVSLDTLDPDRFAAITRRRRLPEVLDGLAAGDRLVLEGTDRLREGSKVDVVEDSSQVPTTPGQQLQGQDAKGSAQAGESGKAGA